MALLSSLNPNTFHFPSQFCIYLETLLHFTPLSFCNGRTMSFVESLKQGNTTNSPGLTKYFPVSSSPQKYHRGVKCYNFHHICNLNKRGLHMFCFLCPVTPVLSVLFPRFSKIQ